MLNQLLAPTRPQRWCSLSDEQGVFLSKKNDRKLVINIGKGMDAMEEDTHRLNGGQALAATAHTAVKSAAWWGAMGNFAWACVLTPVTAPLHLVAGAIGLSNETHFRLADKNIVYQSVTSHLNQWFSPIGRHLSRKTIDNSLAARMAITANRSWHSPALVDIFSIGCFAANAVEAAFRADLLRSIISLIYIAGLIALINLIERNYSLDSRCQSPGVFAGIKAWYQKTVSAPFKAVFANTGFWFPLGNAVTMVEQGVKTLLNPLGTIGFFIAACATVTAMKPLLQSMAKSAGLHLDGRMPSSTPPAPNRFRRALASGFEAAMAGVLGAKAGRAQRIGAVGDFIAAINSLSLGHYEIGIALACWGVSNWLLGGLSNKEAADAAP